MSKKVSDAISVLLAKISNAVKQVSEKVKILFEILLSLIEAFIIETLLMPLLSGYILLRIIKTILGSENTAMIANKYNEVVTKHPLKQDKAIKNDIPNYPALKVENS